MKPAVSAAQQRAQDAPVAILRRHCDETDAHLRARTAEAESAAQDKLCPCGIAVGACLCRYAATAPAAAGSPPPLGA